MFVLGNLLIAIATILSYVLEALQWLVIIRALLSWVSPDPFNPIVRFIERTTEPLLEPFRRLIPSWRIGIDLSPIFALLMIWFAKLFIVRTLFDIAIKFRV